MKCIAIDDEPIALDIIRSHAQKLPVLNLVQTFVSAGEAIAYLQHEPVELIFLDINMPDISGLELARVVGSKSKIIFTTAYSEFAVNGFELGVVDYLLKPISFTRFLQAFNRALDEQKPDTALLALASHQPYLFVKTGYDWERVNLDELLYIEADNNYLTFIEKNKKILTRMKLSDVSEKLSDNRFMKVHKSFIVALSKIEKIEKHQLSIANKNIPLSATYREILLQRLTQ